MSQVTTQKSSSMTAIIFAVFAVVCIVAFLIYRGSDVGQLPKLIANLGGGPLIGFGGFWDSFAGAMIGLIIVFAWYCFGCFITKLISTGSNEERSFHLEVAVKIAVGAAGYSLIWFFLGLAESYNGYSASFSIVGGIVLGLFALKRSNSVTKQSGADGKSAIFNKFLITLIAVPLTLGFISSVAPPMAKDTLLYHFAAPKTFVAQHSSAYINGNMGSYYALGTEMHYVWAMLSGSSVSERAGEISASVAGFAFFPLLLLVIYGWAREIGVSRRWSLVATLMFAAVPTAYHVASSAYIDLALALYITLAVYSLTCWWKEQLTGRVIFLGIFLGAALSIKLTTVFVFAAFVLIILLRGRNTENTAKIVFTGFAALLLAVVIASPWWLRTWVVTGSPVFPFYLSIWKGVAPGWDVERSNLFQAMNSQYGGADLNKLNYLIAPFRLSIAAQPEQAESYDGVLGAAFLIGLPILLWGLWKFGLDIEVKIAAIVGGVMYLFWLFSSEQLRYLLPILPVVAIAVAASAEKISDRRETLGKIWKYSLTAASIACISTSIAWFCQKAPLRVVLGGETSDQYLTRNLDYYPYYLAINSDTPADAKVWLINMRGDTYNIDRPVFSEFIFEDWTLRKMLWESSSVQELRTKTTAMGIKYVLARHDFWFDYDRSTLVDDKKPRAENEAKLKIAKEFILDPANTIKADNKFSLVEVF